MSHNHNQTNRQASLALADGEELLMFADGYDEAILGIAVLTPTEN